MARESGTPMTMSLDSSWSVPRGTPVVMVDRQMLGRLIGDSPRGLVMGNGFPFVRRYHVRLADVARYEDGTILLRLTRQQVVERSKSLEQPGGAISLLRKAGLPRAGPSYTP